jgi:Transposase DDE domain
MPTKRQHIASKTTTPMPSAPTWMNEITPFLPVEYAEKAKEMKAFVRVRKLHTVDDLLRSLFCWAFVGLSLRQLGIWGTVMDVGSLSDRAWSRRLTNTHAWVLWLVSQLLVTSRPKLCVSQRRLRVVDASNIRARQQNGHLVRLHTSYLLNEQRIDEVVVSTEKTAESVAHVTWRSGDLVIADRGYCRRTQIAHILKAQADLIVRWHSTNVPLVTPHGTSFDAVTWLKSLSDSPAECAVSDGTHTLRFIACHLSPNAAERARKKYRRRSQKDGTRHHDITRFLAGWLLLITSLPLNEATLSQILDLYRARWQVELLFKRMKQLVDRHRLPSFYDHPNTALVGILLCGWLLIEAHQQRLMATAADLPLSLWQSQLVLVRAFQQQILGTWSLSLVMKSWLSLQRYLRPSRSLDKLWSRKHLFASLDTLLAAA